MRRFANIYADHQPERICNRQIVPRLSSGSGGSRCFSDLSGAKDNEADAEDDDADDADEADEEDNEPDAEDDEADAQDDKMAVHNRPSDILRRFSATNLFSSSAEIDIA